MIWYLFIIITIITGFFFTLGYQTKTRLWIQIAAIFLMYLGFSIITGGLDLPTGSTINIPNMRAVNVGQHYFEICPDGCEYALIQDLDFNIIPDGNITITKNYENIAKDDVFSKWLSGMLFILLGFIVFFDAFFNNRYQSYI
jgi:ribose/xylose/arabinose/galactoside ABC-type transport system permease subunit